MTRRVASKFSCAQSEYTDKHPSSLISVNNVHFKEATCAVQSFISSLCLAPHPGDDMVT